MSAPLSKVRRPVSAIAVTTLPPTAGRIVGPRTAADRPVDLCLRQAAIAGGDRPLFATRARANGIAWTAFTHSPLPLGIWRKRQTIKAERTLADCHKHVSHAELDGLVAIGDLRKKAARRQGAGRKHLTLPYRHGKKKASEGPRLHRAQFTHG